MSYLEIKTLYTFILREKFDEMVNLYFKDRNENFDDYYPCMEDECNLSHVYNLIQFLSLYNNTTSMKNYSINELYEEVNISY